MKLSELVRLKNELIRRSDVSTIAAEIKTMLLQFETIGKSTDYVLEIEQISKYIFNRFRKFDSTINSKISKVIALIDVAIQQEITKCFASWYNINTTFEEDNARRKILIPDEVLSELIGRITAHGNWQYPGLEIGPHEGEFTKYLLGFEPLYLADVYPEYFEIVKAQYPIEYQARLRTYCITHEKGLRELPQNQFGFVFSWNVFNYLPLEEIKKYLLEVFSVLRPGGTFIFSFNDGNTYNGARHAENREMSFTPKDLLLIIAESYGFEIVNSFGFESNWLSISWLEIKKPGQLNTIRAHSTLGEIRSIGQ